jgi:VCBS repeat-containing protein
VSGPAHGQLSLNPNGTFTYTPDPEYSGPDSFRYTASDGTLASNVATVNLNVTAVNDPPVTRNDAATTNEDAAVAIDVLANDSDPEGSPLKPVIVTQPAHGTVAVSGSQLVYTPAANFFGTDTFTYRAAENVINGLAGNVATVTVTVAPAPDAPVAQPNAYTTDQGVTLTVVAPGVLGNDSDPDGDPLTAAVVSGPANGALTLNPDGSFTYAPNPAFYGTDSFTYAAADGTGLTATAAVTLTVLRTNDPPVAQDDAATTNEDTQVGIAVITNDSDPNGDPIQAVVFTQPANGAAAYSANDGRIYYTPRANFNGTDTFTYRAYDGRAYSAPATVTVTVLPVNE